jgi:predicted dithiol-disulfide oxidoreductase (DUF899 family)
VRCRPGEGDDAPVATGSLNASARPRCRHPRSRSADGLPPHLQARDVTLLLVAQAPLATLQACKRRMGWSLPWVSAASTDFNCDFGASATQEQVHDPGPRRGRAAADHAQNTATTGTDIPGYLSQSRAVSVFTLAGGAVDPQPDGRLECGLWTADHVVRPHGWPR